MLEVDVTQRLGAFSLDASFSSGGRLTALWGPSGSGKTSIVNLVAGLARPDRGRIAVDGRVLVDTSRGIFVPRHRRRIGYVFQDARLFPHLSVRQNLLYGRFFARRSGHAVPFDAVVGLLGIAPLLARRPGLLSGGEKQRVAIGRALLSAPQLILMDEPLASLDDDRKREILPFIELLRDEMRTPIVYVSHAIAEVGRLATGIVLLDGGRVTAAGPAEAILARLDLLPEAERGEGGGVIAMTVVGHDEAFALTRLRSSGGEWRVPRIDAAVGARLRARVRARDIMVAVKRPEGLSGLNLLPARIAEVRAGEGAEALLRLDCGDDALVARVTRYSVDALGLAVRREVWAVVKAVTFEPGQFGRSTAPDRM